MTGLKKIFPAVLWVILLSSLCRTGLGAVGPVRIYFFYSSDCRECRDIKENTFPDLIRKYSNLMEIRQFEINDPGNYRLMTELEEKYGAIKNPPPAVFIGGKLLDGRQAILENLEAAIARYIETGGAGKINEKGPVNDAGKRTGTNESIAEKFKYLGAAAVIGGGLIDGINPCAFAAIIMFVLYLTFTGRKRREILQVGMVFTAAVFISYFLIGLGLLEFVRQLKFFPLVSDVIVLLFGAGAIILGILSLYDFYKIKKGRMKEMTLQLPDKIKRWIKKTIWKKSSRTHYMASAFAAGFVIGILEFPCTGQIYFPIIMVLREMPSLRLNALSYLVLYNLMFIIPLIVVFIIVFLGASSNKLVSFLEKRAGMIKVLTAVLFFVLGGLLILYRFI